MAFKRLCAPTLCLGLKQLGHHAHRDPFVIMLIAIHSSSCSSRSIRQSWLSTFTVLSFQNKNCIRVTENIEFIRMIERKAFIRVTVASHCKRGRELHTLAYMWVDVSQAKARTSVIMFQRKHSEPAPGAQPKQKDVYGTAWGHLYEEHVDLALDAQQL
jgi:hypothetical protein